MTYEHIPRRVIFHAAGTLFCDNAPVRYLHDFLVIKTIKKLKKDCLVICFFAFHFLFFTGIQLFEK